MTCLEKYKQEHGGEEPKIKNIFPNMSGGIDIQDPPYCDFGRSNECSRCWDREVPGTEPTVKLDPKTEQMMDDFLENGLGVAQILDSGERREFDTGAVRDIQEGKGRCDLMPLDVVAYIMPINDERRPIVEIQGFVEKAETIHLVFALEWFCTLRGWDRPTMLLETSIHFEDGAKKYGEHNWQKGIPVKSYIDSAVRHYLKWLRGDKDEPHDRAFCWNILCAIWTCKHKPDLNDYKEN